MYMPLSTSGWEIWQVTPKDNGPSWPVRKQLLPHWPLSLQQGKPLPTPGPLLVLFPLPGRLSPPILRLLQVSVSFTCHLLTGAFPGICPTSRYRIFGCRARDLL